MFYIPHQNLSSTIPPSGSLPKAPLGGGFFEEGIMNKAQLENGYTKIANQILEKMMVINLGPYETRVLMCIVRKTYGWDKKLDWIANSQIVKDTGIYKAHVSRAVSKLKSRNIVTQTGNLLGINTDTSSWLPEQVTRHELPKRVTVVTRTGNSELPKRVDTKETITKETIQKKVPPTSKNSLTACTEEELEIIAKELNSPIGYVSDIHNQIMDKIKDGVFQQKKYGKTVYFTLRNWVRMRMKEDLIKIKQEEKSHARRITVIPIR